MAILEAENAKEDLSRKDATMQSEDAVFELEIFSKNEQVKDSNTC